MTTMEWAAGRPFPEHANTIKPDSSPNMATHARNLAINWLASAGSNAPESLFHKLEPPLQFGKTLRQRSLAVQIRGMTRKSFRQL